MKNGLLFTLLFYCNSMIAAQELPVFNKTIVDPEVNTSYFAFYDFNNDNKMDIIIPNWQQIEVLSSGSSGYTKTVTTFENSIISNTIDAGDFNGDHNKDIYIGDNIYFGDGKGQFPNNIFLNLYNLGTWYECAGDFNNDKKTDIFGIDKNDLSNLVIYQGGNTRWTRRNVIETPARRISEIYTSDVNYDGNLDIIYSYEYEPGMNSSESNLISKKSSMELFTTHKVDILFGDGNGLFQEGKNILEYYFGMADFEIFINDYNNDSISDLICVNDSHIAILKNDGKGEFTKIWETEISYNIFQLRCVPADLNGDKITDMVLIGTHIPKIGQYSVFFGMGNDTFSEEKKGNIDITSDVNAVAISDLNSDGYDDIIASTSEGISTFTNSNNTAVESDKPDVIKEKIDIYPANPNPFNPITTISYSIASPQHVSLSVYNITGQKVAALVNCNISGGNHSVPFDGSNLPSGVYLYRFEIGKFNKTGRMLLIK